MAWLIPVVCFDCWQYSTIQYNTIQCGRAVVWGRSVTKEHPLPQAWESTGWARSRGTERGAGAGADKTNMCVMYNKYDIDKAKVEFRLEGEVKLLNYKHCDAQSTSHRLLRCQVVLTKRLFKVLSEIEFSAFEFLSLITIWVKVFIRIRVYFIFFATWDFEFCCYFCFVTIWVLSQLEVCVWSQF